MFRVQLVGQLEVTSFKLSSDLPAELRSLFIHGHQLESRNPVMCIVLHLECIASQAGY